MNKKIYSIFLLLSFYGFSALPAQVLHAGIATAGENATGTGGTASYTVGQLVYTTSTGTTSSVAQGIQQPFEINVVSGIDDIYGIELLMAYPNPASDFLILKIPNNELSYFSYKLYNMSGSMIRNAKVSSVETSIILNKLKPATYFLRIFVDNKEVKTFKIIKK